MGSLSKPTAADLQLVAWLAEQYGAHRDQLARLLCCNPATLGLKIKRLRQRGFVESWRIFADQPSWVTPTARGLRACGSPYTVWKPRLDLIRHVAAVNEVRLHVEWRDRDAQWVCERELDRDRGGRSQHLPDALVLTEGRRVAIEVELSVKDRRRLERILDELVASHDAVLYFCTPATERVLGSLAQSGRWPSLGIRPLPGPRPPWMR
jgi:DNA-binding MarR family transcriptional regulator